MNTLIVDTSVVVKWLNQDNEQHIDKADKILQDVRDGNTELIAPELLKYELGNVLLKGKQLSPNDAHISLGTLYSLPVNFINESEELSNETFSIAQALGISYYDASFLSLAKQYNASLVTDNIKHQGRSSDFKVIPLKDY